MSFFRLVLLAAVLGLTSVVSAPAHEGHKHGDEPPPPTVRTAPRATAASPLFELVAVANGSKLTVYLDRLETNAPVTGATIDVETPAGPASAVPNGDVYLLDAPWAATPGTHELLFTVAAETDIDFLTATLMIPDAPAPVAAKGGGPSSAAFAQTVRAMVTTMVPERLQQVDPALIGIGAFAFLAGALVTALMRRRMLAVGVVASVLVLGLGASIAFAESPADPAAASSPVIRDVAQRLPDGTVFAPKSTQRILAILTMPAAEAQHRRSIAMPGRVIPDPNASGYVQTAIGGRLQPPPGGFPPLGAKVEAGQIMAYVEPSLAAADRTSIREAKAELDQEISLAERQSARFRTLAQTGAVSRTQLEEAELTLTGLRERRAALEDLRMQAEQLIAPIPGVVSTANASPGLIAETNTEVFHIIDPSRLWVEALSFSGEPVSGAASIGGPDGDVIQLTFAGAGFSEDGQAQPVHFSITDPANRLRPGAMVTVIAETAAVTTGIAAPREAVIRGANGEDIVYVHTAPELFEPRPVRTEPLDGGRVIIVAGIAPGDRLVTQGAELLNQLR